MIKSSAIPGKWIKIMLHAIGWIIVLIIPLYLHYAYGGVNIHRMYEFYLRAFSAGVIFYLGYMWLVPKFFLQEKKIAYMAILFAIITGTYFFTNFVDDTFLSNPAEEARFLEAMKKMGGGERNFRPSRQVFSFLNHFVSSLLLSGFAVGLGVMEKLKQNEKRQKEMEKEKLHSELAFLKNQVSPHFFFNTLNNIYSLIGIDGPTAQQSVLKLSKMMRYLLYESERGETMMSQEIDFMENYIELMKLRLNPRVDLQIAFPKEFADFQVPPLLFIPFIENAFKHGAGHREASFIKVSLVIDNERILFVTENSIGKSVQTGDLQHSGIGLENVKKRLGLLFPGTHELKIDSGASVFKVELSILQAKQLV